MSDERKNLEAVLWAGADVLRSKMDANEYKDYLLAFVFYKYLSDKFLKTVCDEMEHELESVEQAQGVWEEARSGEYAEDLIEDLKSELRYIIEPEHTFTAFAKKAANSEFYKEDLQTAFNNIEQSDELFENLFQGVDLYSNKLGVGDQKQADTIQELIKVIDQADILKADGDVLGNVAADIVRDLQTERGGLVLDDGHSGLIVGRDDVADQAALKTGAQAVCQQRNVRGRTVRGQNNLLAALKELVEGMKKFLFGGALAADELDIVHQQKVGFAVFAAELHVFMLAQGRDQLVRKLLGGNVDDVEIRQILLNLVGDGIEQMRLAQTRWAVDKERVISRGWLVGDGQGRVVGKAVGGADHEGFKGELRIELVRALFAPAVIFVHFLLADHADLIILGGQLLHGVLDIAEAAALNEVLAELGRGVDGQNPVRTVEDVGLIEIGGNDPGRQPLVQIGDDLGPDKGVGIHKCTPRDNSETLTCLFYHKRPDFTRNFSSFFRKFFFKMYHPCRCDPGPVTFF